jgi:dihydrofolate reductase
MGKTLISMSVSLDGFVAGPDVTTGHPMGRGGERLHEWFLERESAIDSELSRELAASIGAVIIGNVMFAIGVDIWEDTPYPVPTIVLTHEPRAELAMSSATFTFVTDGVDQAWKQAQLAAGDKDVLVLGGPETASQFLRAGLVDEIRLQLAPILLGPGVAAVRRRRSRRAEP